MTVIERIFALKNIPGFDQLRDEEILSVAGSMTERRYVPGETVVSAGATLWYLFVVLEGALHEGHSGRVLPIIVGADLLLANLPIADDIVADGTHGALCLRVSRAYFFTIIAECPVLLVETARLPMAAAAAGDRP